LVDNLYLLCADTSLAFLKLSCIHVVVRNKSAYKDGDFGLEIKQISELEQVFCKNTSVAHSSVFEVDFDLIFFDLDAKQQKDVVEKVT
jgi:hypothetical protein